MEHGRAAALLASCVHTRHLKMQSVAMHFAHGCSVPALWVSGAAGPPPEAPSPSAAVTSGGGITLTQCRGPRLAATQRVADQEAYLRRG